jgi:O-antigen ligase
MEKIEFKSLIFEKIWQVLLGLFCVSAFVSKSGISIFGILLILISVFILPWKEIAKNRKEVLIFIGLYPLAIVCNLFSLGGVQSAVKVAVSWPWVLLALPGLVVFLRPRDQKIALLTGGLGLAVACGLSLYYFFFQYGGQFVTGVRVASFWDISRWGLFLASSLIGILALSQYFYKAKTRKNFLILQLSFLVAAACLVLSNTRAPWLAAAAGCLVFILLYPRLLKVYGSYLIVLCLCFALFPPLRDRVVSMFEIQKSADGKMTSVNGSNAGRLHMWQVALEFYKEQPWFGTGFESTVEPLQNYMDRRGPDYKAKYMTEDFSFSDQHSSYLSTLIQMGVIFSVIFWGFFGYLFISFVAAWWRSRNLWAAAMICLMICHGVLFVFYSSTNSYDAIALFPFIPLLVKDPVEKTS